MAEMYGADPAGLRAFATAADDGAQRIEDIRTWMTSLPRHFWKGPDAEAFLSRVDTDLVVRLRQVAEALQRVAGAVRHQAGQQEAASGVDGEGAVAPRAPARRDDLPSAAEGTSTDGGVLDRVGDVVDGLGSLGVAATVGDLGMTAADVKVPQWFRGVGGALNLLGVIGGVLDVAGGVHDGDVGRAAGGGVDVALGAAGLVVGAAAATPVVIGAGVVLGGLGLGKVLVDASLPYSDASADSMLDYTSRRLYGHGRGDLTPSQAGALVQRYSGAMGPVYMISDKMDQSRDEFFDTAGGVVRWVGNLW